MMLLYIFFVQLPSLLCFDCQQLDLITAHSHYVSRDLGLIERMPRFVIKASDRATVTVCTL